MSGKIKIHNLSGCNFAIEVSEICNDNKSMFYPAHRHDFYELFFFTEGEGQHRIDFKEFDIKPNKIYMLTPGQVYEMKDVDCKGYVIAFSNELFYQIQKIENLSFNPLFYNSDNSHSITIDSYNKGVFLNLFSLLRNEYLKPQFNTNLIRNYLSAILINCLDYVDEKAEHKITERIMILLEEINRSFISERKVTYYANKLCLSSKHLNDLCKQSLGKSVSLLIHERLILEAKRDIAFTDKDIKEIAFELEFSDPSYFTRFFKKNVGATPEEFRKISR